MARRAPWSRARGTCVWLAVTAAAVEALRVATPLVVPATWAEPVSFADLLVRVSGVVVCLALVWLWVVATVTIGQLLLGRSPSRTGAARRLVLLACGAALTAGVAHPASATEGVDVLEGLRLPERAVTAPSPARPPALAPPVDPTTVRSAPAATPPRASRLHVVRRGESLWSIAAATSPAGADVGERWRSIWAANRDVVGEDPDLILPGQRLRIPGPGPDSTHERTDETGDRP